MRASAFAIAVASLLTAALTIAPIASCSSFSAEDQGPTPADSATGDDARANDNDGESPDATPPAVPRPLHPTIAKRFGSTTDNVLTVVTANATAIEPTGAVGLVGTFSDGQIAFGTGAALNASGPSDAFVARLDAKGEHALSAKFGDSSAETGLAVAAHGSDVFIALFYAGSFQISPGVYGTNTGGPDSMVARFSVGGQYVANETYGGSGGEDLAVIRSLASASEGVNVFGTFKHAVKAPGSNISRGDSEGIFVSHIFPSSGGQTITQGFCEATATCIASAMASSAKGDIVVGGRMVGKLAFSETISVTGLDSASDAYVAKLDPSLVPMWAISFGGAGKQEAVSIASVVGTDDFIVGVDFDAELKSPSGRTFAAKNADDFYIARVSSTGAIVWEKSYGDASREHVTGIAVEPSGNIHITGTFTSGTLDLGGGPLVNADTKGLGTADVFVLSLDALGRHIFSARYGDDLENSALLAGVDANGGVVLIGSFSTKTLDFGAAGSLSARGKTDLFYLKLEP